MKRAGRKILILFNKSIAFTLVEILKSQIHSDFTQYTKLPIDVFENSVIVVGVPNGGMLVELL